MCDITKVGESFIVACPVCRTTVHERDLLTILCASDNICTEQLCCSSLFILGSVYPLHSQRAEAAQSIALARSVIRLLHTNRYQVRAAKTMTNDRLTVSNIVLVETSASHRREFAQMLYNEQPSFITHDSAGCPCAPYAVFVSHTQLVFVLASWDFTTLPPSVCLTYLFNDAALLYLGDKKCAQAMVLEAKHA